MGFKKEKIKIVILKNLNDKVFSTIVLKKTHNEKNHSYRR
jgi:hypothetical protein